MCYCTVQVMMTMREFQRALQVTIGTARARETREGGERESKDRETERGEAEDTDGSVDYHVPIALVLLRRVRILCVVICVLVVCGVVVWTVSRLIVCVVVEVVVQVESYAHQEDEHRTNSNGRQQVCRVEAVEGAHGAKAFLIRQLVVRHN